MIDEQGYMTIVQGDTEIIYVQDLPTDGNYSLYFSFYDQNRKIIGNEVKQTYSAANVQLIIPSSLTDLLTVKKDEDFAEYYYSLKICIESTGYEETLQINGRDIGEPNYVYVYPKTTEGLILE